MKISITVTATQKPGPKFIEFPGKLKEQKSNQYTVYGNHKTSVILSFWDVKITQKDNHAHGPKMRHTLPQSKQMLSLN